MNLNLQLLFKFLHKAVKDYSLLISLIVVCYCSVGYRSSVLADKLISHFRREGLDIPVFNLEGGVFQWAMDGGPLEGENPRKVHQYSSVWGRLLPENMRYTDAKL